MENEILKRRIECDQKWNDIELKIQRVADKTDILSTQLEKQQKIVGDIQELSTSVALLASNMDGMLKELQRQNERLNQLEDKPKKRTDIIVDTIIKVVLTAALGVILLKIGLQ